MLSVSVMSLWAGLNEASLETTAAAKDDMTGRREVKSRVVSKRWSLKEMGMWPQEAVKGRGHWAGGRIWRGRIYTVTQQTPTERAGEDRDRDTRSGCRVQIRDG